MFVAALTHAVMKGDPFVSKGGPSYELAAIYFVLALMFLITGPGRYSIDRKLFGLQTNRLKA
jgi:putative oxidoreductase